MHVQFLSWTVLQVCLVAVHAQTSVVNGVPEFSGTPVATNPYGIPTLVYNCAKLPAICSNVNTRNALQAGGPGQWGPLQQGQYIELNYDSSRPRKVRRRAQACPGSWHLTHVCPEPTQPDTVPAQAALGSGGTFAPARYNPNNIALGQAGYNRIANAAGQFSGMIWTCDEWPPASTVEGGINANTYCAPQNSKCAGTNGVDSEQDFQSRAHSVLRLRASGLSNPRGIYNFHFKTEWMPDRTLPATRVEYFAANAELTDNFQRRSAVLDDAPIYLYSDGIYENRSLITTKRLLEPHEIDAWHGHRKRSLDILLLARNVTGAETSFSPAKQLFGTLPKAPLLAIDHITKSFVLGQQNLPVVPYLSTILRSTIADTFRGVGGGLNSTLHAIGHQLSGLSRRGITRELADSLAPRQDGAGACNANSPCPDGSCCNKKGQCGYGPENCGAGNCTSNCDATAACGQYSKGGNVSCPLNVCCSAFGYCGTDAQFCNSPNPEFPCQKGFGSCSQVAAPTCGGSSATGRTIAYYQVANVRERQCERITPAQINLSGLTHLYLAFATIDPTTFALGPANAADVNIYSDFTALKSKGVKTWIAVGGWDFNDPGPTRTTFSDLASTASNRAKFIQSAKNFMSQYGFQGLDIDWEYPGAPDRAGKSEDTQNFVALVKEMRAAFGTTYGISVTLPSSYWYLRWFDPISMQPYVDFFGLMTYDLHGPWDAQVADIGQKVYGQTNIPEIYNWTLPLWYDKVDPGKINLGLAYYGRGYTLSDSRCNSVGCAWSGPSRPLPCTNFGGVASLQEIESNLIPALNGVKPTLLADAMMKQLTWSDQWIGYDDNETIAMKKTWASQHCYGGTMVWSIDLYSGTGSGTTPDGQGSTNPGDPGSGGGNGGGEEGAGGGIVYIDPSIWSSAHPTIQCQPPCTFILPPTTLAKPTTVSFPLFTTSLDVAWSESTGWTSIIETTVLTIPPVTTTAVEVWAWTVSNPNNGTDVTLSRSPTASILPPPFTITDNPNPLSKSGVSHSKVTRTITPPPYPYSVPTTTATTTSSSTNLLPIFPIVTYKPGTPGPICKTGCGHPCLIFCNTPCLINCVDPPNDFPDPINPTPPKRPTPTLTPGPKPTMAPDPNTPTQPPDPKGTDPQDPEEEEDDDSCAYEFGLPAPQYDGPIGADSSTPPVIIPSPTPAPSPTPSPNPTPPSPNPSTESLHCYNSGLVLDRGYMIKALNAFCTSNQNTVLLDQGTGTRTLETTYGAVCDDVLGCFDYVRVSVTVINGCQFTVGGDAPDQQCGRILREAIDQCDQSSTKYKQGGTITSNCAQWLIDPNLNWGTDLTGGVLKKRGMPGMHEYVDGGNFTDFKIISERSWPLQEL